MNPLQFKCSVQLVALLGGVRKAYYIQLSDIRRGEFDMVKRLTSGDKRLDLVLFMKMYAPQLHSRSGELINSIRFSQQMSPKGDQINSVIVTTFSIPEDVDITDEWLGENLSLCGTYNPEDKSKNIFVSNLRAAIPGVDDMEADLITYVYPDEEEVKCESHSAELLSKFRACMPGLSFEMITRFERSENSIISLLFDLENVDLRTEDNELYSEVADGAVNLGYNIGLNTLKNIPQDKMTPEKRGMLMYMVLHYINDPMTAKIFQNMSKRDQIEYESRQTVLSETVNDFFQNDKGPDFGGLFQGGKKSRKRTPLKSSRNRKRKSHQIKSKSSSKRSLNRVKLVSFHTSSRPDKKYMVTVKKNGRNKTIHFGDSSMKDYTKFSRSTRESHKSAYLSRHSQREHWSDPLTAGFWSRWILWGNSSSVSKNLEETKRKFNL